MFAYINWAFSNNLNSKFAHEKYSTKITIFIHDLNDSDQRFISSISEEKNWMLALNYSNVWLNY